jgi:hypothetical protein
MHTGNSEFGNHDVLESLAADLIYIPPLNKIEGHIFGCLKKITKKNSP